MRARIAAVKAKRATCTCDCHAVVSMTPPIYDAVYFEALEWMDRHG
ncbi:MAG: hypothetical protein Q8S13_13360 [Dehalococcoidia bacterium]|nr:hypothetical protein [Dehalococcoidia bacterium]